MTVTIDAKYYAVPTDYCHDGYELRVDSYQVYTKKQMLEEDDYDMLDNCGECDVIECLNSYRAGHCSLEDLYETAVDCNVVLPLVEIDMLDVEDEFIQFNRKKITAMGEQFEEWEILKECKPAKFRKRLEAYRDRRVKDQYYFAINEKLFAQEN